MLHLFLFNSIIHFRVPEEKKQEKKEKIDLPLPIGSAAHVSTTKPINKL